MESFYGGRQGASFVIKRYFDYIGEKGKIFYKYGDYLYDISNRGFIVDAEGKLISRKGYEQTLTETQKWKLLLKDGSFIVDTVYNLDGSKNNSSPQVEEEIAETMIDLFSQGGATTNQVNYGEYVIINAQRGNEMGKDNGNDVLINGRVYRRGLDYNGPMAGAEFIGQICGPQGMSPELYFDSFNNIKNYEEISSESNDIKLIQGTKDNSSDTVFKIRTERNPENLNGVNEYKMGIQIPYSGFAFSGNSVNYNQSANAELKSNESHNFFHSYLINIPDGVPGNDFSQIFEVCEEVNTNTSINYYTYSNGQYIQETNPLPIGLKINTIFSNVEEWIIKENDPNYDNTYIKIQYPENSDEYIYYVKRKDTYKKALWVEVIEYNKNDINDPVTNKPIPTKRYYRIGEYKIIKDITLSENGEITVSYDADSDIIINKNHPIQWIEETVIVDADTLKIVTDTLGNINYGIPNIGDILVRYNTNKGNIENKFFYPVDNDVRRIWHRVGVAQELTGIKIYMVADDLAQIGTATAESVPPGWGIFVPAKKNSGTGTYEEAYVAIKNGIGTAYNNPLLWPKVKVSQFGIGQSPELIATTNYATGVQNLEQELLFGKDLYIEEYIDNAGNRIVETSYCNENTFEIRDAKYYKVVSTLYDKNNIEKTAQVIDNTFVKFITDSKYVQYQNNTLILKTGKMYNFDNTNIILKISSENVIKKDILYLVTVGQEDNKKIILTKETIEQTLPNGRKVIKEINTIGN